MPWKVSTYLSALADTIESKEAPSRSFVAAILRETLAALPKPKAPIQFPPMKGNLFNNPKEQRKTELPPSLEGVKPKEQWYPDPRNAPKKKEKVEDPSVGKPVRNVNESDDYLDSPEHERKVKKQLDRNRRRIVSENPEMESAEAFIQYLNDDNRDSYTIQERDLLSEANQLKLTDLEKTLEAAGKYQVLKVPTNGVYTPKPVIEKAAKEIGVEVKELEDFIRGFDEHVKKRSLVDSENIVEAFLEFGLNFQIITFSPSFR